MVQRIRPRPAARGAGALAAAVALSALLAGCQPGAAGTAPAASSPEVTVSPVLARSVRPWDEFNGRIAAVHSVEVRPRVSGAIERVAFVDGQEVRRGDLLFVIDPRPYRAALASAQAGLERARAAASLAQLQAQRAQTLAAGQAISQEEHDTRSAGLAQSRADVRAAEAAVAQARLALEFTEVRSPIAGRAGRALLTAGNLAQADQSLLATVVSQDPVQVHFDADEQSYLRYLGSARRGERAVQVGLADEAGFPHTGRLDFMDNRVDPATGTIRARAVLANPAHRFTPGLFARVRLEGGGEAEALLVDEQAVLTDQDRKYVYVVGDDGKAVRKDVTLGRRVGALRVVQSGLEGRERVVVDGMQKIFYPGMPVQVRERPPQEEDVRMAQAPAR